MIRGEYVEALLPERGIVVGGRVDGDEIRGLIVEDLGGNPVRLADADMPGALDALLASARRPS